MSLSSEHGEVNTYWFQIATNARNSRFRNVLDFKSDFGVSPSLAELIYRKVHDTLPRRSILFGLYFLKNYPTDLAGAKAFQMGSIHTWRRSSRIALFKMERFLPEVLHSADYH